MNILDLFFDENKDIDSSLFFKRDSFKKNISYFFIYILFLFVFLGSFLFVVNFQKYNISVPDDDMFSPYKFSFSYPARHRYIGSGLFHFFLSTIPDSLNLHVNDVQNTIIAIFIAFTFCSIVFLFVYIPFMFIKDQTTCNKFLFNNKKLIDISKISLSFILLYILSFLILFNDSPPFYSSLIASFKVSKFSFFYNYYFNIIETVGFLEYILNVLPYLLFIILLFKLFFDNNLLNKKQIILFVLLPIYLALSVEIINLYIFLFLSLLLIFSFYFLKDNKQRFFIYLYSYIIFIISFCFYYCYYFTDGESAEPGILSSFISSYNFSILKEFIIIKYYPLFIKLNLGIFLSNLFLFILSFIHKNSNKSFLLVLLFNFLSIIFSYFFISFFMFATTGQDMLCDQYFTPIIFFLFVNLFFLIGYSFRLFSSSDKIFSILITIFCCFVFFIYRDDLLFNYLQKINISISQSRQNRIDMYKFEKAMLFQIGNEHIYVPHFNMYYFWESNIYYFLGNYGNIFYNTKCIHFDDEYFEKKIGISPEEEQTLNFSRFLQYRYPIKYPKAKEIPIYDYNYFQKGKIDTFCF